MRVAVQKVDGVEHVRVSLNDGLTIVDLRAHNAVTMAKLRQIVKNNGFVSKDASVLARGEPNGRETFIVDGTGEKLVLSTPAQKTDDGWRFTAAAPKQ